MTASTPAARTISTHQPHGGGPWGRRVFQGLLAAGSVLFALACFGIHVGTGWTAFGLCFGLLAAGALGWIVTTYRGTTAGIKNNGAFQRNLTHRGWMAWLLGGLFAAFYLSYYWWPVYLKHVVRLLDPLSQTLRGVPADHWFFYSYLYSFGVLLLAVRMFLRYRHSRYQLLRTVSVTAFQLVLAFLVPSILRGLGQPEYYFTYFWPLLPDSLYPGKVQELARHPGGIGTYLVVWGALAIFVLTPVLTWRFGKRWYCSWVCGCGGLAETLGDPFRHLSDKRRTAWRFERWSIHLVLLTIVLGTILLWVNEATGGTVLGAASEGFRNTYKFLVVSLLAGLVGVSFYPLMGGRVWCRFFCPMAAILGIVQRYFSRFRITTNGGQCMSCGNCSTYCEMGIDVRSYAQRGANVVRASCVGCGICSAVCPRGVLNLENGPTHKDRFPGADQPLAELRRSLHS